MSIPSSKNLRAHVAVWCVCLAIVGCGGGNSTSVPEAVPTASPLKEIPSTATASILGLLQYQSTVNSSTQAEQDKAEPIDVSGLTLPTSETAEPFEV